MLVYAIGERSGEEEDQLGQEPVDDRCRQLEEEIRLRDEGMASMMAKMEALMAQLRALKGQSSPRASASVNPQPELAYDLVAFPPFLNYQTLWA